MREHIRTVRFHPYRKGMGPTFTLALYDCGRPYHNGPQWQVGYRLRMHENGKSTTLFDRNDFGCSPLHAIDSNACVASIMGFLTLEAGGTDEEFFDDWSDEALAYRDTHAAMLGHECRCRFPEE